MESKKIMDAENFVRIAKEIAEQKTVYASGFFGQNITKTSLNEKRKQYPNFYNANCKLNGINHNKSWYDVLLNQYQKYRGFDCVCYIKYILWNGKSTGNVASYTEAVKKYPDITTQKMMESLTDTCKPKDAKFGYILANAGHVGIALGDGYCLECNISKGGVVKTPVSYQPWTIAGKLPAIDYVSKVFPDDVPSPDTISVGDKVYIVPGAVYGGLWFATRGKKVPLRYCGHLYTVSKIAKHFGKTEYLIRELNSWVSADYVKKG